MARLVTAESLAGYTINLHADHVLRTLRRPREDGDRVPDHPPPHRAVAPCIL